MFEDPGDPRDAIYSFDEAKLTNIREMKAWQQDPRYFKRVKVSPSAVLKMLTHAQSGVEKGITQGGKPIEVMGLLLGRPDTEQLDALIVTDVFPLPVEGFETRVVADDQHVINYMIQLGESLELTRKERLMGWYHSHPFDVTVHSHCFLSSTDITTQLQWQRLEDAHGNPWLAIVIDPLRSIAKGQPVLESFRVYPPEFTAPLNETPDGTIVTDDSQRVERWGSVWNRYYVLSTEYFMSSLGSKLTGILSEKFLWMRTLGATPMLEKENKERFSERVNALSEKLNSSRANVGHGASRLGYLPDKLKEENPLSNPARSSCDLAIELCQGQTTQISKDVLFNSKNNN